MKSIGFVTDPVYLAHDTGHGHPESPARLQAVLEEMERSPLRSVMKRIVPTAAEQEAISAVHRPAYVEMIRRRVEAGEEVLDGGDTHVGPDSWRAAVMAAGGVLKAVDEVLDPASGIDAAFCAVRPPGHHAESDRVMGFCLYNNVAIAARYARTKHGAERVAIVDWDVHHGNGTQEIFYEDPSVLYISLHQYPFYPGTGSMRETGAGRGEGFTLNCPMPAGSGEKEYQAAFDESILPLLRNYRPQLLFISAGFDAHRDDPLAHIMLTEHSYGAMTNMLGEIASAYGSGKIVSVLEGGYDLGALGRSVRRHCETLAEM